MTIETKSAFRYGWVITDTEFILEIDEGFGAVQVELDVGSYSQDTLASMVAERLNDSLTLEYTVDFSRVTRKFTISASGSFDMLFGTGVAIGSSAAGVLGFNEADKLGLSSYESDNITGSEFRPQFLLQDYVSLDDWREAAYSQVNESANGDIEVVKFGNREFLQCNIKYQTNNLSGESCGDRQGIEADAQGVENLRLFMQYVITKGVVEFYPDRDNTSVVYTLVVESTQSNRNGTGYKLNELYSRGLKGFFETGILKFRRITQ